MSESVPIVACFLSLSYWKRLWFHSDVFCGNYGCGDTPRDDTINNFAVVMRYLRLRPRWRCLPILCGVLVCAMEVGGRGAVDGQEEGYALSPTARH